VEEAGREGGAQGGMGGNGHSSGESEGKGKFWSGAERGVGASRAMQYSMERTSDEVIFFCSVSFAKEPGKTYRVLL